MNEIIHKTVRFVKESLRDAEAGHDWWHVLRVWNTTKLILQTEEADRVVCELAALLHDIADSKFYDGDETIGPRVARDFLESIFVDTVTTEHVVNIIQYMSFKNSFDEKPLFHSKELEIVQDADRLDAIGAIGIARAFHYGGYKNREMYNPDVPFERNTDKTAYKYSTAPTIHHFYDKLLLLRDSMNTATARQIAARRHAFMEEYLQQFHAEWNGQR